MARQREVSEGDGAAETTYLKRIMTQVDKDRERRSDRIKRGMYLARQRRLEEQRGSRRKGAQRVCGYVRISDEVTVEALAEQIRALLDPNAVGPMPAIIAIDVGCQGMSMDRPGLRHLLYAAERGLVKKVVVHDRSRLARSAKDAAYLLERFNRLGVRVHEVAAAKDLMGTDESLHAAVRI